jgi:hypothetical protein
MIKSLDRRLVLAERAVVQQKSSEHCICFPAKELPFFNSVEDQEMAHRVKCPLHGDRFRKLFHLYIAPWRKERAKIRRRNCSSPQFKKAWLASGLEL